MAHDLTPSQARLDTRALLTGEGLPACDQQVVRQCRHTALTRFALGGVIGGGSMHWFLAKRNLMTANRRFVFTTLFTVWVATTSALSSSPSCLHAISHIDDPNSVLKKELKRIVVMHNPNTAQQHVNHKPTQS